MLLVKELKKSLESGNRVKMWIEKSLEIPKPPTPNFGGGLFGPIGTATAGQAVYWSNVTDAPQTMNTATSAVISQRVYAANFERAMNNYILGTNT